MPSKQLGSKASEQTLECDGGLQARLLGNPDFGTLTCELPPGETLLVESGAMAAMSAGMEVKSRLIGGFLKALFRKIFGGESLFVG